MADFPEQLATDEPKIEEPIKNEIDFLKEQTRRLSNELLMYQKASGMGTTSNDMASYVDLPSWMENEQTMSPLLLAYDLRIHDLGTYMEQQGAYLDAVTERSAQLLKENEELRSRLMSKFENTVEQSNALSPDNANGPSSKKFSTLLEENELLRNQSDLLVKELQEANKTIVTRDKSIEEMNEQMKYKFETISELGRAVKTSSKKKSFCESALSEKINEIMRLKLEISDLSSNIDTLTKQKSELRAQCETTHFERCRLESEIGSLILKVNKTFSLNCHNFTCLPL